MKISRYAEVAAMRSYVNIVSWQRSLVTQSVSVSKGSEMFRMKHRESGYIVILIMIIVIILHVMIIIIQIIW